MRKKLLATIAIFAIVGLVGCQSNTTPDAPITTPTSEPTATNTQAPEPTPTEAVELTATPEPTPTNTPLPAATSTPTPTDTPVPTATNTPTPMNTPVPTATSTPTPTNTPVPTATSTPTPTNTPAPTASFEELETTMESGDEGNIWVVNGISYDFMYYVEHDGAQGKFTGIKNDKDATVRYFIIDENNIDALVNEGYFFESSEITKKVRAGAKLLYFAIDYCTEMFGENWYNTSCNAFYVYGATRDEMIDKVKEEMTSFKISDIKSGEASPTPKPTSTPAPKPTATPVPTQKPVATEPFKYELAIQNADETLANYDSISLGYFGSPLFVDGEEVYVGYNVEGVTYYRNIESAKADHNELNISYVIIEKAGQYLYSFDDGPGGHEVSQWVKNGYPHKPSNKEINDAYNGIGPVEVLPAKEEEGRIVTSLILEEHLNTTDDYVLMLGVGIGTYYPEIKVRDYTNGVDDDGVQCVDSDEYHTLWDESRKGVTLAFYFSGGTQADIDALIERVADYVYTMGLHEVPNRFDEATYFEDTNRWLVKSERVSRYSKEKNVTYADITFNQIGLFGYCDDITNTMYPVADRIAQKCTVEGCTYHDLGLAEYNGEKHLVWIDALKEADYEEELASIERCSTCPENINGYQGIWYFDVDTRVINGREVTLYAKTMTCPYTYYVESEDKWYTNTDIQLCNSLSYYVLVKTEDNFYLKYTFGGTCDFDHEECNWDFGLGIDKLVFSDDPAESDNLDDYLLTVEDFVERFAVLDTVPDEALEQLVDFNYTLTTVTK